MTFTVTTPALGRTVSDFCDELRREYLDPQDGHEVDRLNGAITSGATSVFLDFGASSVRPQARLEIGNEILQVWQAGGGTREWVVARGWDGSTAAAAADEALVRVNPRWTRMTLARQLARELRAWPAAVCIPVSADFEVTVGTEAIDLDGLAGVDVRRVLRVVRENGDPNDAAWPAVPHTLERSSNATAFPSGYALYLPDGCPTDATLRVTVGIGPAAPAAVDFTDDLGTDYGLTHRLADAAMLGVAGRLLMASEVVRTDTASQPRARVADDVPAGHRLQAGEGLLKERDRLLKLEVEAILNAYGMRG